VINRCFGEYVGEGKKTEPPGEGGFSGRSQETPPPPGLLTFGGVFGRVVLGFAPPEDPLLLTVGRLWPDPPLLRTVGLDRVALPPLRTVGLDRVALPPLRTVGLGRVALPPLPPPGVRTLEEGRATPELEPLEPAGSVRILLGNPPVEGTAPDRLPDGRAVEAEGVPPDVPDRRLEPLSTPGSQTPEVRGGFPDVLPGLKADGVDDLGTALRF
jgi:hypothetical protein